MQMAVGNASKTKHYQRIVKMMLTVLTLFILSAGPWHMADLVLDTVGGGIALPAYTQIVVREVVSLLIFANGWAMPIVRDTRPIYLLLQRNAHRLKNNMLKND